MTPSKKISVFAFGRFVLASLCFGALAGCGTDGNPVMATEPSALFSEDTLVFPATTVGTAAAASTVTLTNMGSSPLLLNGYVLSDTKDFRVTTTCGTALGAGASCGFNFQFTPQSAAVLSGTLTLTDNSHGLGGAQQVVTLSGTGAPVPVPQAVVAPASLSFGPAVLHTTSAAQMVTVSNAGTAPLEMSGTVLTDTTDFSVPATTCGSSLPPGASCTVSVAYLPQAVGPASGNLLILNNSGGVSGVQQAVALSGMGLPVPVPQLSLSPAGLAFAPAVIHTQAAPQLLTLSNTGSAALAIDGISLNDTADFAVTSTCGATLAAGSACALAITFDPQTTGALNATVTLTDNSGLTVGTLQQKVSLSGTGLPTPVPKAVLTPVSGGFGSVNVGSASTAQSFTLLNSGDADLLIGNVALNDTKDYALTNGCGATLGAGASCTLGIVFQPQGAGDLNATLTVNDNSGGQMGALQSVALSGTGVALPAPAAQLTPSALSFADTMQSLNAAPQTLTLTNTGDAALVLAGMLLSDTQDFTLSSTCPASLAPATSCTLTVGFEPQVVATFHAMLTISDNAGSTDPSITGMAQQTVSITANGIAFEEPRAVTSPASLTFPQTVTNSGSAAQLVTLTNTGTQPLHVASVSVTGASAAAFQIASGNCTGSVAAGASCTESIVYGPKLGSASDTASLTFTDDALGQVGSTQGVALAGAAVAEVDSVENFGDSITCGFYALPNDGSGAVWSMEGYAGLLDTYLGVPAQNWCRQGDTAADLSRLWVPFHSTPDGTGNQLFTLMVGTNDAYRYGLAPAALQTYTAEVGAAISWLAIPNSDKVLANAITQQTGTWSPDAGFGMMSTDADASLTFTVNQAMAGRNLYLVYHVWAQPYGQAGKASIAVDGIVQATVEESQNSGAYLPTENGTNDTYLVQVVPLGAAGSHTVTFRSVGPSGSAIGLLWAGVAQQDYRTVDGAPEVLVGYVPNSPSGNQTFAADNYTLQLMSLLPALAADGMNVKAVNTSRVMDPNTDFADILHPNNSGHMKLATAFEQAR